MEHRLVPEQCEFHKRMSCWDKTYVLKNVVGKRFNENKDTFAALIVFEDYFDYIDNNMLSNRLLENKIDAKFYKSTRSAYWNTYLHVQLPSEFIDWFENRQRF